MLPHKLRLTFTCYCIIVIFLSFISCSYQATSLTQNQLKIVKDSVEEMMNLISKDVSNKGSSAWLQYFEKSSNFFMASEGRLVFPSGDSAASFISHTLVKQIHKINLEWSNIQIDPLSIKFASVAAYWHENTTDFKNNTVSQTGYFTAMAENTSKGWQLRNAHWSAINKMKNNPYTIQ